MSHQIEKNDIVYSIEGTEWHGLAQCVPTINRTITAPLEFPLRESVRAKFILDDGSEYDGGESKGIFADLRGRNGGELLQLSTMGEDYSRIDNAEVLDCMERAFSSVGVDYKITTAGTLGDCRKFFLSVALSGHEEMTCGGDKFLSYVNFITSHDGTLACQAYDSNTRIVCMNTLRWSLEAAGAVDFKVKHTKNAAGQMENLEQLLSALLNGRDVFKQSMDELKDESFSVDEMECFAKGYLAKVNKVKKGMELSTRSRNAAASLVNLYLAGEGNSGESTFDAFNAGTEYWTGGEGTGSREGATTAASRVCKSAFGMAAEHKNQWTKHLTDREARAELVTLGKGFQSIYC